MLPQIIQNSFLTDTENGKEIYGRQPAKQEDVLMAKSQSKKKPNWDLKGKEEIFEEDQFLFVHPITFNYAIQFPGVLFEWWKKTTQRM